MRTIHVQVPAEHYQALEVHAQLHDRSLSAEVRRAIRLYLAPNGQPPTDKDIAFAVDLERELEDC